MNLGSIFKQGKLNDSKHDFIVSSLVQRLIKNNYEKIFICAKYNVQGISGEADILAKKGRYILNFEMKESFRSENSALKQLKRTQGIIEKLFPEEYKVINFYVHGFAGEPCTKYSIKKMNS